MCVCVCVLLLPLYMNNILCAPLNTQVKVHLCNILQHPKREGEEIWCGKDGGGTDLLQETPYSRQLYH